MRFDYENQQPATFTADVTNFALTTTLTVETNSLFNQLSLDNVTTFEDLQAEAGAGSIQKLMQQLDSYKQFYQGVLDYTAGVSSAYDGSRQLVSGSQSLQSGTNSLVDGISQLQSGGLQLSESMKKFQEQGLQKLVDTVNDNLSVLVARLEATIDASNQYRIYTDLEKNMTGSVKFIYRTESIDAPLQ